MATKKAKAEKRPDATPLPAIDPLRRYPVPTAIKLLGISRKLFYSELAAGNIKTIAVGSTHRRTSRTGRTYKCAGRRFVPGSELVRVSAVPT
jgi:hypothetical protein